ncbi:MAG: DUF2804 family protein [Leptospiraceae bacterium]|nr:DUF2804 family protein [Leptospiraceae bacterium]MCK6381237.1 DUF2804 family protein [Leptospiraceae bacterium]NUM41869.1 DUF2804 family protein [Leptospiraceae bacterium]
MAIRLKKNENFRLNFKLFENELKLKTKNFLENPGLYQKLNLSENIIIAEEVLIGMSLVACGFYFLGNVFLYDRRKKQFLHRNYQSFLQRGFSFQGYPENGFWTFDKNPIRFSYRSDLTLEHGYLHSSIIDPSINLQLDTLVNLSEKNVNKVSSILEFPSGKIFSERAIGYPCQGVVSWNDKVYDFSPKTDKLISFFSAGNCPDLQYISLYFLGSQKKSQTIAGFFSNRLDEKNHSENIVWKNGKPIRFQSLDFNLNKSQKTCTMKNSNCELRFIPENYIVQKIPGKFFPIEKFKIFGKVSGKIRLGNISESIKEVDAFFEF